MLNAPRGVTKMAGEKAYAAKLAISPMATVITTDILQIAQFQANCFRYKIFIIDESKQ